MFGLDKILGEIQGKIYKNKNKNKNKKIKNEGKYNIGLKLISYFYRLFQTHLTYFNFLI